MDVSVVIPTKNRGSLIERTINSVLNQKTNYDFEIIVVDDASTDNTKQILKSFQQSIKNLIVINNDVSLGGAVSRNIGADNATGDYIAFLDSDDEWESNHLENKIKLLNAANADGCFGAFTLVNLNGIVTKDLPHYIIGDSIVDYLFTKGGDTRTSTFIFRRKCFSQVKFDNLLKKHQDWDLAIRFSEIFEFIVDYDKTVILHNDVSNRMSNSNNHEASAYFYEKHKTKFDSKSKYSFFQLLSINTLRFEGVNQYYYTYINELKKTQIEKSLRNKVIYVCLRTPVIRQLFAVVLRLKHRK